MSLFDHLRKPKSGPDRVLIPPPPVEFVGDNDHGDAKPPCENCPEADCDDCCEQQVSENSLFVRNVVRSSAKLNNKQLTDLIERLRAKLKARA